MLGAPTFPRSSIQLSARTGLSPSGGARRGTSIVPIRAIRRGDHDGLRAFYASLGAESRRTRFLGARAGIGDPESDWFCSPDHEHREGFVALLGPGAAWDTIVGHVCVEPDGAGSAEIAVAVADEIRGRGIGRVLVEAAVDWAIREGIGTLTATMLGDNPAIQRLLTTVGCPSTSRPVGGGVVEIRIDLSDGGHLAA